MTLVILDMQDKYLADLTDDDRERVIEEVSQEIIQAREGNLGIVIAERNVKEKGETSDFVLDLVAEYEKVTRFEHSVPDAGDEVLAITRQQNFSRKNLRVCGLYGDATVRQTVNTILYSTNFQTPVTIVEAACGCVNHLYSDKDCLNWAEKLGVEIV